MIFTTIEIVFLLILVFLVVTWVAWFIFLWLSKLWYETSSTHFNRITVRDLFTNSFAVFVYGLCLLHSRITNRYTKMTYERVVDIGKVVMLILIVVLSIAFGYSYGYGNGYKACSVNYGVSE
jgi:hypothetical protein